MTVWEKMYGGFVRDPTTGALVTTSTGQSAGAVEIQDGVNPARLLTVLADGSINVNSTPGTEVATAASGGNLPGLFKAQGGSDGVHLQPIKTDSSGVLQVDLAAPIPGGSATIGAVNQGTAAAAAGAWPGKVTDGTNVAAVKAASTAPVATDPALVVVLSPNAPVTGTFWQTTQPVSGTFWQTTQPVSGTFWQTTQPVSGTVTSNQGTPGSVANAWPGKVTDGTNIAAVKAASTAPVATDPALVVVMSPNAPVTPVSGTFWQSTQPVSGTVTANQGTAAAVASAWPGKVTDGTNVSAVKAASTAPVATDPALVVAVSPNSPAQPVTGTFWQNTQPVSGTFWQGTQPVSAAALPLPVGAATDANIVVLDTDINNLRRLDERMLLEMRQVSIQLAALTGIPALGDSGGF